MKMNEFQKKWVGKTYRCKVTGEILIIPEDVKPRQFFTFGECFIDVGDGWYSRRGGPIEVIE